MRLGPLSEEVLTDLAPLAEHKDIVLNCSGGALIIGSDTLLYRLVFNLVENAIRYSRPGSTVNVSICDNDSHVFLRVEDQAREYPSSTVRASSSRSFAWINPAAGHTAAQDSG